MEQSKWTYKRAETQEEVEGALKLRYEVFCKELKDLPPEQCPGGMESDEYDKDAAHFIVKDGDRVVGNTRVVPQRRDFKAGAFGVSMDHYYDLSPLYDKHGRMAEMGRTCFLPNYRGRASLARLWTLVYHYVTYETACPLGLSMGCAWTDSPEDFAQFWQVLKDGGFVAKDLVRAKPGFKAPTKAPTRRLQFDPAHPYAAAPALKMYLDVGFKVLGEPVYVEHFNEYEMLVGCPGAEVKEPYLSLFRAVPKEERRRQKLAAV